MFPSAPIFGVAFDPSHTAIKTTNGVTGFIVSTPVAGMSISALSASVVLGARISFVFVVVMMFASARGPRNTAIYTPNNMTSLVRFTPMATGCFGAIKAVLVLGITGVSFPAPNQRMLLLLEREGERSLSFF